LPECREGDALDRAKPTPRRQAGQLPLYSSFSRRRSGACSASGEPTRSPALDRFESAQVRPALECSVRTSCEGVSQQKSSALSRLIWGTLSPAAGAMRGGGTEGVPRHDLVTRYRHDRSAARRARSYAATAIGALSMFHNGIERRVLNRCVAFAIERSFDRGPGWESRYPITATCAPDIGHAPRIVRAR